MEKPPCVSAGLGVTPCLRSLHTWKVYGSGSLHGDWEGWRIAGRFLIAPGGRRISQREIDGILRIQNPRSGKLNGTATGDCTTASPTGLPAPSDDGGPVAPAGAVRASPLRGTWLQE